MSFGVFCSLQDDFIEIHQKSVQASFPYKVMFEYARTH